MLKQLVASGLVILAAAVSTANAKSNADVFGWLEKTRIEPWGVTVKAKLDSGALTSSMHAENIERFRKNGENWVRFTVKVRDEASNETVSRGFERPVYRRSRVRGAGGEDRRPVVLMKVCIKDVIYEEQFSLRDRENMLYPVLLGRRTLRQLGAVDVVSTYLHEPKCTSDSPVNKYQSS